MVQNETSVRSKKRRSIVLRRLSMVLVAFLACILATASSSWLSSKNVVALGGIPIITNKVSKSDIEDAKKKRDEAQKAAQNAANMVSQLEDRRSELQGELAKLNAANEEQKAQYVVIAGQLEAALEEKAKALDEYIQAQENLEYQQQLFTNRISVMFEYQNKSTLEVLLESDSIAGFFTNMELITLIADSDAQAVDMLQVALDDAQLQADIKLQYAEEMQAIADEKQRQLDELQSLIGTTEATIEDVQTDLDSWEAKEDELEAYAASLEKTIKDLQAKYDQEQAAANAKVTGGVSFRWPTYCHSITSYYGNRVHPVYGTTKFHSGIDIGAGYGDTIMAAAAGTVILVSEPVEGQNKGGTGYGNYCIVQHANGYSTLYGHARDIYVSEGQSVSAGQSLGEVGSTGTSTGAHLHFEVRLNGSTKNPLNYLP